MPDKVAVVIPVYNGKKHLLETLLSVLQQTLIDRIHIYVADDGSTDGTADYVTQIQAQLNIPNFSLHIHPQNVGKHYVLNWVVQNFVREDYFLLLDADDILVPQAIEKMLQKFETNPQLSIVRSSMIFIQNQQFIWVEEFPETPAIYRHTFHYLGMGLTGQTGCLWKTQVFLNTIENYQKDPTPEKEILRKMCCEDFFRLHLISPELLQFDSVPDVLILYRLHDQQWSANTKEEQGDLILEKAYRRHMPAKELLLPRQIPFNQLGHQSALKHVANHHLRNMAWFWARGDRKNFWSEFFNLWKIPFPLKFLYIWISCHALYWMGRYARKMTPEKVFAKIKWWYPKLLSPTRKPTFGESKNLMAYYEMIHGQAKALETSGFSNRPR